MDDKGNAPLLETIDLKKYFKVGGGTLHAVDSINIKLYQGETLGVVGESGCGKSTLGRTILKLIEPTAGHIIYDGKDITSLNIRKMRPLRREMQIIFQDPYSSIDPRKSVIETISEYMFIHKSYPTRREIMNRAVELMDMVGLARRYADAYPHELDGGRRQRIGIARALSLQPRFIVCDDHAFVSHFSWIHTGLSDRRFTAMGSCKTKHLEATLFLGRSGGTRTHKPCGGGF